LLYNVDDLIKYDMSTNNFLAYRKFTVMSTLRQQTPTWIDMVSFTVMSPLRQQTPDTNLNLSDIIYCNVQCHLNFSWEQIIRFWMRQSTHPFISYSRVHFSFGHDSEINVHFTHGHVSAISEQILQFLRVDGGLFFPMVTLQWMTTVSFQ
jgi:hypothetical protein